MATTGNTLDKIIADLEAGRTPSAEAQLVEKVAGQSTENQVSDELVELRKLASDITEQAHKFAEGFVEKLSELTKSAVGVTGITPNTAAVPDHPAVQVSTEDAHLEDVAKVEAIIKKLTLGGEAKFNPSGAIYEQNVPVAASQPIIVDEHPVAYDYKKADAEIITKLYEKYWA